MCIRGMLLSVRSMPLEQGAACAPSGSEGWTEASALALIRRVFGVGLAVPCPPVFPGWGWWPLQRPSGPPRSAAPAPLGELPRSSQLHVDSCGFATYSVSLRMRRRPDVWLWWNLQRLSGWHTNCRRTHFVVTRPINMNVCTSRRCTSELLC
jgi:hypothetical protein